MRSLESVFSVNPPADIESIDVFHVEQPIENEEVRDDTTDVVVDEETVEIPDRMFFDSEVVGYSDKQLQIDTYNFALMGNIPITGPVTICDIGAKRGDLARYISETYQNIDLVYIGYESNDLLVAVSDILFKNEGLSDKCAIRHAEYINDSDPPIVDVTIMTSYLINNPAITQSNKWSYCESILKRVIPKTLERVIIVALHDDGGDDAYVSYPLPNMTELLLKFNHPFKIDFGRMPDMYTIIIDTTTKRFLA